MSQLALVGDVGGTNARFALVRPGVFELQRIRTLPCADYSNLDAAVADYLRLSGVDSVRQACIAFACPVHGESLQMTNNHWGFAKHDMAQRLGLERFKVINDFTAQALSVPHLAPTDLIQVGGGAGEPYKPKLIIGPGTGLGVSGLVQTHHDWVPLAAEGGHVDFAPTTEFEVEIWRFLKQRFERVSVERILSGSGLALLYEAYCAIERNGLPPLSPETITQRACAEGDALCLRVLNHFCGILGAVAGNAALTLGALGGVYIAGGIVPRFVEQFARSPFREAFEAKGRFREYMAGIPVYVMQAAYPGLLGAAEALTNEEI